MARLFDRQVRLTLIEPKVNSFFGLNFAQTTIVENLRVQFNIEKTLDKRPNSCRITVSNMKEETRNAAAITGVHARLEAGYNGELHRLFAGDTYFVESEHEGTEWETAMEFGDGKRAFANARLYKSWESGVTVLTLVKALASTLGLKVSRNVLNNPKFRRSFPGGYMVRRQAQAQLSKVLASIGYDWSIQNGELQILEQVKGVRTDIALEVSQETGMVGTPSFGTAPKKGKPPTLTVETLLYPQILPGGRILMKARSIGGLYKVVRVNHAGDTHQRDWYSKIEAVPV